MPRALLDQLRTLAHATNHRDPLSILARAGWTPRISQDWTPWWVQ